MPKPSVAPFVGETVQFYELHDGKPAGPHAAIVTAVEQWEVNHIGEVELAVLEKMGLRFIPLVPYNDGGVEAGYWWVWPTIAGTADQN